jgi:hypothetical protein
MKAILAAVLILTGLLGCYSGVGGYYPTQGYSQPQHITYSRIGTNGDSSYGSININPSGYYYGYDTKKGAVSGYMNIESE